MQKNSWTRMHTIGLLAVLVLLVVFASQTKAVDQKATAPWTWYVTMVLLAAFIVIAGQGVVGRPLGFLIDSRNKMTLSRLQLLLWTVLVLSAYLTVAIANIVKMKDGDPDPLAISLPPELWWLMGISTASMVGSPLILSNKKTLVVKQQEVEETTTMLAAQDGEEAQETRSHKGAVMVNESPDQARIADLFRGDEVGNAAYLDLGKIQMFFFTIILILAYFFTIRNGFGEILKPELDTVTDKNVYKFPALSQSMITLLGISHAGYLSHKALPHSQTAAAGGGDLDPDPPPGR